MPPNTMEYGNTCEDDEPHLDIDLRAMIDGDPWEDNDLILAAFRDDSFSTEGFAEPPEPHAPDDTDIMKRRVERARAFTGELSHGTTQKSAGGGDEDPTVDPIVNPVRYSRTHGENWRDHMQATADFGNTLKHCAEQSIFMGLTSGDETLVAEGRQLLADGLAAERRLAGDPGLCGGINALQEKLAWPDSPTDQAAMAESTAAQAGYLQALREAVTDPASAERVVHRTAQGMVRLDCEAARDRVYERMTAEWGDGTPGQEREPMSGEQAAAVEGIEHAAQDLLEHRNGMSLPGKLIHRLAEGGDGSEFRSGMAAVQHALVSMSGLVKTPGGEEALMEDTREARALEEGIRNGTLRDPSGHLQEMALEALGEIEGRTTGAEDSREPHDWVLDQFILAAERHTREAQNLLDGRFQQQESTGNEEEPLDAATRHLHQAAVLRWMGRPETMRAALEAAQQE